MIFIGKPGKWIPGKRGFLLGNPFPGNIVFPGSLKYHLSILPNVFLGNTVYRQIRFPENSIFSEFRKITSFLANPFSGKYRLCDIPENTVSWEIRSQIVLILTKFWTSLFYILPQNWSHCKIYKEKVNWWIEMLFNIHIKLHIVKTLC